MGFTVHLGKELGKKWYIELYNQNVFDCVYTVGYIVTCNKSNDMKTKSPFILFSRKIHCRSICNISRGALTRRTHLFLFFSFFLLYISLFI